MSGSNFGDEVIQVEDLGIVWRNKPLLSSISFKVPQGACVALLGPNGSGKTTTVRSVCGLLKPTKGCIRVFGEDTNSLDERSYAGLRKRIGVQSDAKVYEALTGFENLEFWSRIYGLNVSEAARRADELLDIMGLLSRRNHPVSTYSKGMKQRVAIARALVGKPELLVLDEPTSGLDPQGSKDVMEYITNIRRYEEVSVLLSSHRLRGLDEYVSHAVFLDSGRSVGFGTLADLRNEIWPYLSYSLVFLYSADAQYVYDKLLHQYGDKIISLSISSGYLSSGDSMLNLIVSDKNSLSSCVRLAAINGSLISCSDNSGDLEQLYFEYIKEN